MRSCAGHDRSRAQQACRYQYLFLEVAAVRTPVASASPQICDSSPGGCHAGLWVFRGFRSREDFRCVGAPAVVRDLSRCRGRTSALCGYVRFRSVCRNLTRAWSWVFWTLVLAAVIVVERLVELYYQRRSRLELAEELQWDDPFEWRPESLQFDPPWSDPPDGPDDDGDGGTPLPAPILAGHSRCAWREPVWSVTRARPPPSNPHAYGLSQTLFDSSSKR